MKVVARVRGTMAVAGAGVLLLTGLTLLTSNSTVLAADTGAAGAAAGASKTVTIPQGSNPTQLKGAAETGPTDQSTQIDLSIVLRAQNQTQLYSLAGGANAPARMTEPQFAATYGQPQSVINSIENYLHGFGLSTYAYSNGLDISATGNTGEVSDALSVKFNNYAFPSAGGTQHGFGSPTDPILPTNVGSAVLAVLGLSNYSPFASQAVPALNQPAATSGDTVPAGEFTPAEFTSHYDLTPLLNKGDLGQGQTIGIVTLASFTQADAYAFWGIIGQPVLANRITEDLIDGGSGPVSLGLGSDETSLDVEQSGAIAPQAKIIVYEAPNTDPGFLDAFAAAASQDLAGSVSASWGEDETFLQEEINSGVETPAYEATFDEMFAEMVMQGQASFLSAGDQGAYDAQDSGPGSPYDLAVDASGDSPFTTSAGGTTLPGTQTYPIPSQTEDTTAAATPGASPAAKSNQVEGEATQSVTIPTERAWSWDYLWPLFLSGGMTSESQAAHDLIVGGGGGYSAIEPRPQYQESATGVSSFDDREFINPTDYQSVDGLNLPFDFLLNPAPGLGTGSGATGRAEPDLSFNADPQTGYAVYAPTVFGSGTPFQQYGGTSFVAPQLNAVTAVYDSAAGARVGFWNQFIYTAAQSNTSPFNPMSFNTLYGSAYFSQTNTEGQKLPLAGSFSNDNLYYTGHPGTIYSPAVGLGFADLTKLYTFASIFGAKVP